MVVFYLYEALPKSDFFARSGKFLKGQRVPLALPLVSSIFWVSGQIEGLTLLIKDFSPEGPDLKALIGRISYLNRQRTHFWVAPRTLPLSLN